MKKRIHINQHNIRHNNKNPNDPRPVVTCKTYKKNYLGYEVKILGESTVNYSPLFPLPCGAKVWIETDAPVEVITAEGLDYVA
jgi:hypothetical protein